MNRLVRMSGAIIQSLQRQNGRYLNKNNINESFNVSLQAAELRAMHIEMHVHEYNSQYYIKLWDKLIGHSENRRFKSFEELEDEWLYTDDQISQSRSRNLSRNNKLSQILKLINDGD